MKNPGPRSARFIHPVHAKGVQSRGVPTLRGPVLSDAQIERYIRQGRYGEAARLELTQAKHTVRKPTTSSVHQQALAILNS